MHKTERNMHQYYDGVFGCRRTNKESGDMNFHCYDASIDDIFETSNLFWEAERFSESFQDQLSL